MSFSVVFDTLFNFNAVRTRSLGDGELATLQSEERFMRDYRRIISDASDNGVTKYK